MRDQYHATSTPPRPVASVNVQVNGLSGGYRVQNVVNRDPVGPVLDTMAVTLSGTKPALEALFLDRYERACRMTAARKARGA